MKLKYILVIYASFMSFVHLRKSKAKNKENIFNQIYVIFPDDPCNDEKIEIPDFSERGRTISEVKCLEYTWRIRYEEGKEVRRTQCDKIKDDFIPVLGGTDVSHGEYAHMGALGWKAKVGTWIFKCGGSLISDRYVLTAAHCSSVPHIDSTVSDVEPRIVRLGCKNIMDKDKGEPAYDINIRKFISYHRFNAPQQYYDIALVELDQEVSFSWKVHPSCLWTKFDSPRVGTVTGWGVIETATLKTSPELQKAEIRIIDSDECDVMLEKKRSIRKWWGMVMHQICAFDSSGLIDTCGGDSGGPLQVLIPLRRSSNLARWKLHNIVGVTSFGFGCARPNSPGIYTRVASFVSWIEDIVWPRNESIQNRFLFNT